MTESLVTEQNIAFIQEVSFSFSSSCVEMADNVFEGGFYLHAIIIRVRVRVSCFNILKSKYALLPLTGDSVN